MTTSAKRTITSMTDSPDSPYSPSFDPASAGTQVPAPPVTPAVPAAGGSQLIAPVWHTVAIVLILLVNSYVAFLRLSHNVQSRGRLLLYVETIAWQLLLFGLVWIGLRLKKTK